LANILFSIFLFVFYLFSSSFCSRLSDLAASGVFCAGFLEASGIKGRTDLFDLLIDLSAKEVVVSEHAKEV
jgi:hypothetical protein